MSVTGSTPPPPDCLNCGAPLSSSPLGPPRFCAACGQETTVQPPTLREFAQQFGGAYFSTEGAMWRTLKLLLFKPGELTRQYLAGRRKHYVLPLRLYLTISVLVLVGVRLIGAVGGGALVELKPEELAVRGKPNISLLTFNDGTGLGLREGVFYCNNFPDWLCKRAQRRIDIDPKAVAGEIEQFKDRFIGNVGGAMFLLLPSFALWLKLVYWNRRLRYTEHLVFALHVHSFWFLAMALVFSGPAWLAGAVSLGIPLYTFLAMKRVYGGRWRPRLLRGALVSMLYGVLLSVALTLVALWSMLA
jgi:hypothetical protein